MRIILQLLAGFRIYDSSVVPNVLYSFRKAQRVEADFKSLHDKYVSAAHDVHRHEQGIKVGTSIAPVFSIFVAATVVAMVVKNGYMPVSIFVVYLSTVMKLRHVLSDCFSSTFLVLRGYVSLKQISHLLNSNTSQNIEFYDAVERHKDMQAFAKEMPEAWNPDILIVHGVAIIHENNNFGEMPPVNCRIDPGQLVCCSGGGSAGKTTFLRLIARHYQPSTGFVYFPPSWRVRFIGTSRPAFFGSGYDVKPQFSGSMRTMQETFSSGNKKVQPLNPDKTFGSLEANLRFGEEYRHPDEEIWQLLVDLRVSSDVIGGSAEVFSREKKQAPIGFNGDRLSSTNRVLIAVARILLSSPDLVLLANTLDGLELSVAQNTVAVLAAFVKGRGLPCLASELTRVPATMRNPKLVIFSTNTRELEAQADGWLRFGKLDGSGGEKEAQASVRNI